MRGQMLLYAKAHRNLSSKNFSELEVVRFYWLGIEGIWLFCSLVVIVNRGKTANTETGSTLQPRDVTILSFLLPSKWMQIRLIGFQKQRCRRNVDQVSPVTNKPISCKLMACDNTNLQLIKFTYTKNGTNYSGRRGIPRKPTRNNLVCCIPEL